MNCKLKNSVDEPLERRCIHKLDMLISNGLNEDLDVILYFAYTLFSEIKIILYFPRFVYMLTFIKEINIVPLLAS